MRDFRTGYLYSLAPIHPGGEGDLGNILDIVREAHTNFPYLPGSSLRGCLRDEVEQSRPNGKAIADRLFGQELDTGTGDMGVHQVWFGDARLLWVPMRTMAIESSNGRTDNAFTWVSCHSLIRDHALLTDNPCKVANFPNEPVGTHEGTYWVADSCLEVQEMSKDQKTVTQISNWASPLSGDVKNTWESDRIVLPDGVFEVLMEHSLWTQIRNKLTPEESTNDKTQAGSAEVFWTDICIPRDTILYFPWGYRLRPTPKLQDEDPMALKEVMAGLIQVGGQANVGRGWVQSWVNNDTSPLKEESEMPQSESQASDELEPAMAGGTA